MFDSYRRDDAPHIYLWRQKIYEENCFHVISDIDNIMDNVFGYLNFCEGCYQTTYATSDMHKQYYCKRVEAHDQFMKNRSWRIHPDNIRGAVIASGYGKPVSEQVRAEQLLQLEYLKDTGCVVGIKRSLAEAESDNDTVPLEEDFILAKFTPRAHK